MFKVSDLPDFEQNDLMNRLRSAMGAPLISPISIIDIIRTTLDDLLVTDGIDVSIGEIKFAIDGTILYEGRKVILYIRDVTSYHGEIKLPKFHLSNCTALQHMWARNRSGRYVVATRHDGLFSMRTSFDSVNWEKSENRLDVCKFCLTGIDWDGYASANHRTRVDIFSDFMLSEFFKRYPNSPITVTPKHTDVTAPVNGYSKDFPEISLRYRKSKGWRCEECSANLSESNLRQFLHVHHVNHSKNDNSPSNLRALCIECHVKQDSHDHMNNTPDLAKYRSLKPRSS
jgi:hypothetical protein